MQVFQEALDLLLLFSNDKLVLFHRNVSVILSIIYPILFSQYILETGKSKVFPIDQFLNKFLVLTSPELIKLEFLRLLQVTILMKSLRVSEEYENEEEEEEIPSDMINVPDWTLEGLGISLIAKDSTKIELYDHFKAEGEVLFNQYLRIYRDLKPAMLTGWINLLHPIVQSRPNFYPFLIPTLLSFTESKWSESFSLNQRRNVLHTLKAELSTLMSVPKAEKFYSLILDSMDKCTALHSSSKSEFGPDGRRIGSAQSNDSVALNDGDNEEEERELAASLGGIQDRMGSRPSGAFAEISTPIVNAPGVSKSKTASPSIYESIANEALSRELSKIPVPMVTEMVVRMLSTWSIDQIQPVIASRWKKVEDSATSPLNNVVTPEVVLKKTTEEAFSLAAEPMTLELPGEIIHLGMARILQSITDLSEFHSSSRRDDLISTLNETEIILNSAKLSSSGTGSIARGIPIPLVPLCRIVALVAAHVGSVRSDVLMDAEERRKKLDRQFDPRFRAAKVAVEKAPKKVSENADIFGSSDSEDDNIKKEEESNDDDKTVNQIVLGWINEDLPGRFDFVWYWLEAVWVREGKLGNLMSDTDSDEFVEYDKLFDDVIGVVGEYFISDDEDEDDGAVKSGSGDVAALERVLKVILRVPKLNASLIRNLLYPLLEDSRYRPVALHALAQMLLQRPVLRAMLTDFVMTLAESEDSALRRDTIDILLLREGLYPGLKSLSSQLEAYSLDLMDDLASKSDASSSAVTAASTSGEALKRLKLDSTDAMNEESITETEIKSGFTTEDLNEFEANTELFVGLLKRNPERLLPPLMVRFPQFNLRLQAFLLERSLPHVVQAWSVKEFKGLLRVLEGDQEVQGSQVLRLQIVQLVLSSGSVESTDADTVDFYTEFTDLIQMKIKSGSWNGQLIPKLIPWILRDRSDIPEFFSIYLPKLLLTTTTTTTITSTTTPSAPSIDFLSVSNIICGTQLISPTQLFLQLHLLPSGSVPLKNLIEVLQQIFGQVKQNSLKASSGGSASASSSSGNELLFTVQVIASGLAQLIDQTPLPPLLGRSLLQSIPLLNQSSPLNSSFLLSLLARLIPRKIWEAGKLWEGWIRSCRALLPGSLSILLQLPTEQLEKLLKESGSDLKAPLKEYLYNQPPSVRNRYTSILAAIEKK